MRRTLLFCTLFVFGFFSSVVSQDAPAGPGTRVRVWTEVNEKGPRTTGRVAAWNSDSLILNPVGAGNRRSIPVTSVSRMDVSRGQWSMGMGALRGGGAGFLIGGVSGVALVYLSPEDGFGTRQIGRPSWAASWAESEPLLAHSSAQAVPENAGSAFRCQAA